MDAAFTTRPPEVSVLLSCHNDSRWLSEAIDSVLGQTFEDFEFILVDDGSSDESLEIMKRYEEVDRRVVIVAKQHTGLTDSLITGINIARGRWIARLDGDDVCEPNRLADQLAFSKTNDVVLIGSGFTEINASGERIKTHRYPSDHRRLARRLMRSRGSFPHSSAFFDRKVALRAGSYNRRFLKSQDRDLWLRLAERGNIACVQKPLLRVRKHSRNISNSTAGHPQFLYGTAAASCAALRQAGVQDPSIVGDEPAWDAFLDWMSDHRRTEQAAQRRASWGESRSRYFAHDRRMRGLLAFVTALLRSGSAVRLVREKFYGSSLPEQLAKEWIQRSCAAS